MSVIIKGQTIIKSKFVIGPQIVTDGLILYLDAGNAKSYPGSGEVWSDLTPNKYSGNLIGSPTFDSANGGSIVLNGTNYVNIANTSGFNDQVFTYCGWLLNSADSLYWNRILSKKLNYADNNGYEISLSTGSDLTLYCSGSSGLFATITVNNWLDKWWHYLVVIYSGSTVTVYCDNQYKGQDDVAPIVSNSRNLWLGKIESEDTTQWNGKMANIAIYNKALDASEVSQNYFALKFRFSMPVLGYSDEGPFDPGHTQ